MALLGRKVAYVAVLCRSLLDKRETRSRHEGDAKKKKTKKLIQGGGGGRNFPFLPRPSPPPSPAWLTGNGNDCYTAW